MSEFLERLPPTPASVLKPGDRGIGVIDLGDGQPFPIPVTVVKLEEGRALVRDMHSRAYLTTSLLAVNQDIEVLLGQLDEEESVSYEEARRARYRERAERKQR